MTPGIAATDRSIVANLAEVKEEIRAAGKRYGLAAPPEPRVIAVSKMHAAARILPLLEAGHLDFGENRVQEAKAKWSGLKAAHPEARLHLIGPLQTNKAEEAVTLFDAIHTLDRPKLAEALAKAMAKTGRKPMLFIQVNTGKEPQKAGVMPEEAETFILACRERFGPQLTGLMCIPPADEEPAPHFALLRTLAERCGLPDLSMGMSGDYALAAALGATYVRVGSAIFGARG